MTQYLISFDDGAMTFRGADLPSVARPAHEGHGRSKDLPRSAVAVGVRGGVASLQAHLMYPQTAEVITVGEAAFV